MGWDESLIRDQDNNKQISKMKHIEIRILKNQFLFNCLRSSTNNNNNEAK